MRSFSLLIVLWIVSCSVKGQSLYPGGVKRAVYGYITDTSAASPELRSLLTGDQRLTAGHAALTQLDFHSSLSIDGSSPLRICSMQQQFTWLADDSGKGYIGQQHLSSLG